MSVHESVCVRRSPLLQKVVVVVESTGFCLSLLLFATFPRLTAQESVTTSSQTGDVTSGQAHDGSPRVQPQQHSSDVLTYWYGPTYHTPFVVNPATGKAEDIARNSIEYTHAGAIGILSSFADVTMNQSDMAEPAANGGTGATELYAILRPGVSLNALTGLAIFRKGALRDITFEVGANLESKNSSYAPGERTLYIGPRLDFALPRGFFNVGLHARKEWNHEGVLGRSEDYDPDFNVEPTWMIPFALGKMHLAYSGLRITTLQREKTHLEAKLWESSWCGISSRSILVHRSSIGTSCSKFMRASGTGTMNTENRLQILVPSR